MPRLPPSPELEWNAEGAPRASAFEDVYFSRAGGLAEAEAVFLNGTGLPDAWRNRDGFALCELGFGTGLNILTAWSAWKKTRLPHAILHISSIEAFPLARCDAARALAQFPEVGDLAERLLARWPVRAYGPQRLWFPEDGFALTLWTGDAERVLAGMRGQFDAWFWDGFAPARNATMWSEGIAREIARLSKPGARLASFTVAGGVRRALEAAGFTVEKKPGFGAKRERLEAVYGAPAPSPALLETDAASPGGTRVAGEGAGAPGLYPYVSTHSKRVAIIGAGIASAATAQALMRRGVEVVVLDEALKLGAGASGNPAGLVMPRLDRGDGPLTEFFLASYLAAISAYAELGVLEACGVEERAGARDAEALADLLHDPPLPEDWFAALCDGALHKRAGLVRPGVAVEAMLRGAQLMFEAQVGAIDQAEDGAWVLRAPDGRAMLKADAVVLACGAALTRFAPAAFLPIALSRGQIEWGAGLSPTHAMTRGSYLAPFEGGVLFGATFEKVAREEPAGAPALRARAENIEMLRALAPEVAASVDAEALNSRVSYRATTPDRAPVAGALPDADAWLAQYADLAHGRAVKTDAPPPAYRGVYVLGGLGARGLTSAPLLGERLASEMFGEPQLLSARTLDALHPARFLHRALKRR
jgi:tRNA 5-methylaminomethyl-2-thiouridine biosynthesis bifunctional protein